MRPSDTPSHPPAHRAVERLAELLREHGWAVAAREAGPEPADLRAKKADRHYSIEVKYAPEGRADRLVPLWAQAWLQAVHAAAPPHRPCAVVVARQLAPSVAEQLVRFARDHVPDAAGGVLGLDGVARFFGPGLEAVRGATVVEPPPRAKLPAAGHALRFSDVEQWLIKVLLAADLPDGMLNAPRDRYRSARQLALAAGLPEMSAARTVRALRHEGFLENRDGHLTVVRRRALAERWSAAVAARQPAELHLRALFDGSGVEVRRALDGRADACLALFAAAEARGFGFVQGVPTHVYVPSLSHEELARWPGMVLAQPHERPQVVLRQPRTPRSVFGCMTPVDGVPCADVLQLWLDVAAHPTRGREQADLVRRRALHRALGDVDG